MSKKKPKPAVTTAQNPSAPSVRSSAAEYLSFVAASGQTGVETVYADENVWLTQKMMGLLYGVETHTINYHLKKIFTDRELEENSVIRNFRITAADGKSYDTLHYNLSAIIAVGYKVNSERAIKPKSKICLTRYALPATLSRRSREARRRTLRAPLTLLIL